MALAVASYPENESNDEIGVDNLPTQTVEISETVEDISPPRSTNEEINEGKLTKSTANYFATKTDVVSATGNFSDLEEGSATVSSMDENKAESDSQSDSDKTKSDVTKRSTSILDIFKNSNLNQDIFTTNDSDEESSNEYNSKAENGEDTVDQTDNSNKGVYGTNTSQHMVNIFKTSNLSDIFSTNDSEDDSGSEHNNKVSLETEKMEDCADQEKNEDVMGKMGKKQRKSSLKQKKNCDDLQDIHRESQRMIRQSRMSLPYHKPRRLSLQEFLDKRKRASSCLPLETTLKTNSKREDRHIVQVRKDEQHMMENGFKHSVMGNLSQDNSNCAKDGESVDNDVCLANNAVDDPPKIGQNKVNNICIPSLDQVTQILGNSDVYLTETSNNKVQREPMPLSLMKKRALEFAKNFTPKLSGAPNTFIDLDIEESLQTSKPSDTTQLMEQFIKHSTYKYKKSEPQRVHLQVIMKETLENNQQRLKKEDIIVNISESKCAEIEKVPGQKVALLRESLLSAISKKQKESWENRLLTHRLDNEEQCEDDAGHESSAEEEEEEEEIMTESSEDEDEGDDQIYVPKKPKKRSAFVDDEAEEDGLDNDDDDDFSDDDQEDGMGNNDYEKDENDKQELDLKDEKKSSMENPLDEKNVSTIVKADNVESNDDNQENILLSPSRGREINSKSGSLLIPSTPQLTSVPNDHKNTIKTQPLTLKSPEMCRLESCSSDALSSLTNTTPNRGVTHGFATQNLYLSPLDDLDDENPIKFPQEQNVTSPTSVNQLTGRELLILDSEDISSQNNMDELLELCSGKFTGTTQAKEVLSMDNDNEILSIVDKSLSNGFSQLDSKVVAEEVNNDEDEPLISNTRKIAGGRRMLFLSSDEESEDEKGDFLSDDQDENLSDDNKLTDTEDELEAEEVSKAPYNAKEKLREDFFDNEAELSGSDVGSEDEEEGSDLDQLEDDIPDEELPSDEELRNQIGRVHLKSLLDEDQKRLRLYQEMYLEDGDLYDEGGGRERKFRWSSSQGIDDDIANQSEDDGSNDEADGNDHAQWRVLRHERQQWLEESGIEPEDLVSPAKTIKNTINLKKPFSHIIQDVTITSNENAVPKLAYSSATLSVIRGSFLKRSNVLQKHIANKNGIANADGARSTKTVCFRALSPDLSEKQDKDKLPQHGHDRVVKPAKRIKLMNDPGVQIVKNRSSRSIFDLM